jgi:hypothetical protein
MKVQHLLEARKKVEWEVSSKVKDVLKDMISKSADFKE